MSRKLVSSSGTAGFGGNRETQEGLDPEKGIVEELIRVAAAGPDLAPPYRYRSCTAVKAPIFHFAACALNVHELI